VHFNRVLFYGIA